MDNEPRDLEACGISASNGAFGEQCQRVDEAALPFEGYQGEVRRLLQNMGHPITYSLFSDPWGSPLNTLMAGEIREGELSAIVQRGFVGVKNYLEGERGEKYPLFPHDVMLKGKERYNLRRIGWITRSDAISREEFAKILHQDDMTAALLNPGTLYMLMPRWELMRSLDITVENMWRAFRGEPEIIYGNALKIPDLPLISPKNKC